MNKEIIVKLECEFTGGLLAGLKRDERVTFPTQEAAEAYAKAMDGKHVTHPCGGTSPYRVLSTEIEHWFS